MATDIFQDADTAVVEKVKLAEPKHYQVVLLNDDFTPMEFVVQILMVIFHKQREDAIEIMLAVHTNGRGVAGIYSFEVAEQKRNEVLATARSPEHGHPLMAVLEEAP